MDAKDFLCSKVTLLRWVPHDLEHSSFDTWSYGHTAVPWELELTTAEWGSLAKQSYYFHTVQWSRTFDLLKYFYSMDGTEVEDGFHYNLAVPLFSNQGARDVVSQHFTNNVRYFGNCMELLPARMKWPKKFKRTMAVHLEHLHMGILVLIFYKTMATPFDEIISTNICVIFTCH